MKVDDIIRLNTGKRIRVFRVTGVYLGSAVEEDIIGVECLDMNAGNVSGKVTKEMLVPRHMVELAMCNEQRILQTPLDVQMRCAGISI